MRRDEVGRARRMGDVFVRRLRALALIGPEQRTVRVAAQHGGELPGEVLRVLHARIGAARAERRDLVGGVAGEDHAAMDEAVEAAAVEAIERHPFELERTVAEYAREARDHALRRLL